MGWGMMQGAGKRGTSCRKLMRSAANLGMTRCSHHVQGLPVPCTWAAWPAIFSNWSVMNELRMAMDLEEMPVSGCTCGERRRLWRPCPAMRPAMPRSRTGLQRTASHLN